MKKKILCATLLLFLITMACTAAHAQSNILIAYFSRVGNTDFPPKTDTDTRASINVTKSGIEGNTEHIARMIQSSIGGDLHLIKTERTYRVNYKSLVDDAKREGDEGARPSLAGKTLDMNAYDIVFIGFPNWWYDMPMAVYTFLETYDLSGKTIIPFVTHGGSGFSDTRESIAVLEPGAKLLSGLSIYGRAAAGVRQKEIDDWLKGLGLKG